MVRPHAGSGPHKCFLLSGFPSVCGTLVLLGLGLIGNYLRWLSLQIRVSLSMHPLSFCTATLPSLSLVFSLRHHHGLMDLEAWNKGRTLVAIPTPYTAMVERTRRIGSCSQHSDGVRQPAGS